MLPQPPSRLSVCSVLTDLGSLKTSPWKKKKQKALYCSDEARLDGAVVRRAACRGRCRATRAFLPAASRLFLSESGLLLHTHTQRVCMCARARASDSRAHTHTHTVRSTPNPNTAVWNRSSSDHDGFSAPLDLIVWVNLGSGPVFFFLFGSRVFMLCV